MNIVVRAYKEADLSVMIDIWNQVVEDGVAFPQEECLIAKSGQEFFCRTDLLWRCGRYRDRKDLWSVHPASE